jgi:hypothetical protein
MSGRWKKCTAKEPNRSPRLSLRRSIPQTVIIQQTILHPTLEVCKSDEKIEKAATGIE